MTWQLQNKEKEQKPKSMPTYLSLDSFSQGNTSEDLQMVMSEAPFCRRDGEAQWSHLKVKARSYQVSHEWERKEEKVYLCPTATALVGP